MKLAIFFSGNGTNCEHIIKSLHNKTVARKYYEVVLCLSNNPNAGGIKRALKYGLKTKILPHKDFKNREDFDAALVDELQKSGAKLCVLAGFMRILGPSFCEQIRAINVHPSLLPLYKGANALKESFEGVQPMVGASVHFVSEELDAGKIITQEGFLKEGLSFKEYEKKLHELEHKLLVKAILQIT